MRARLLAAVSLSALVTIPALAQVEVEEERTEPIRTSTADDGSPADIVIGSNGRVVLTGQPGPAVVLDSDNSVKIEAGQIVIEDVDNATGVEIRGGNTGEFVHGGRIDLNDSFEATDSEIDDLEDRDGDGELDPDNEPDGPFAEDSGKTGVLVTDGTFVGNLIFETGSAIRVVGQDSFGLRLDDTAALDGNIDFQSSLEMRGERSRGISIEGPVSGNVEIGGTINLQSPDGEGVVIEADIGGGVQFTGNIAATGYRINSRTRQQIFEILDAGDDDLNSGPAARISASVANGIFVLGRTSDQAPSTIAVRGEAPAMEIRPGESGSGDITIGRVLLPEGVDSDRTDPADRQLEHGVVIEGNLDASGVFDGKNATGLLIAGRDSGGTMRGVIIEGGVRVAGQITATAYDGTATAARIGAGVEADEFVNDGTIEATTVVGFEDDGFADDDPDTPNVVEGSHRQGRAYGLVFEEGSDIGRFVNDGVLIAVVQGAGAGGAALKIDTDTLTVIENTGRIAMVARDLLDGVEVDTVAIDARGHDGGLTINHYSRDDSVPIIQGDVLFGDGNDRLIASAGLIEGDIAFGDGQDVFELRDTSFIGGLSDSDGLLTVDAENSRLALNTRNAVSLTSMRLGTGTVLDLTLTDETTTGALITASDTVRFEDDSRLAVNLAQLVGESRTFELITADSIFFADRENALAATEAPFLYNTSFETVSGNSETLALTLTRKTASELGLNANQTAAFNPVLDVFDSVEALGAAIASIRNQADFFQAYDQLLPEYAASAIQFALASNDAAQGALATRLHNARIAPDELAGLWAQEFGYYADRSTTALGPGYRGEGVGLAIGIDRPLGPFYAVGVNFVGAASEIEETEGFDEPMVALTGQVGGYAAIDFGGWDFTGSAGLGYDSFETDRSILIGSFESNTSARWSGWHVTASGVFGRDFGLGNWVVRPEAALTYLALFESGYSEDAEMAGNEALALVVDDRESSTLSAAATLALARRFGDDVSWWAPSLRLGYRGEFLDDLGQTTARFGQTGNPFTLRAPELPTSGALVGLGLSAGSNYSTFTFAYDADIREDFIRHVARLIIRLTF